MNAFGRFLRETRENADWTLRRLADRLGVSAVYLSDVERGRRNPLARKYLLVIADALGVPVFEFEKRKFLDNGRVELDFEGRSDAVVRAAFELAEHWPTLTDGGAADILKVLTRTRP